MKRHNVKQQPSEKTMPSVIQSVFRHCPAFGFLHRKLASSLKDDCLLQSLLAYIDRYIAYHRLSPEDVAGWYCGFIERFDRDLAAFERTGRYPVHNGTDGWEISREQYEIALLLSTVLTVHRYRIMELTQHTAAPTDDLLIIGCGSGIEIEILKDSASALVAYDLSISDFVHAVHRGVEFRQESFLPAKGESYDSIYLIEVLEHLNDPYVLIDQCLKSLRRKGMMWLTTATDLPQFDHRYNFPADHHEFLQKVVHMGLEVVLREDIDHKYLCSKVKAKNAFFQLRWA